MIDCFDADVVIYANVRDHPLGRRVRPLFTRIAHGEGLGVGSLLLLPEVLAKPIREGATNELSGLVGLLSGLDLRPVDVATADAATSLAAKYRLRAADAVHLATAVVAGADRFITNNRRDFDARISEVDVTHPDELPDPVDQIADGVTSG